MLNMSRLNPEPTDRTNLRAQWRHPQFGQGALDAEGHSPLLRCEVAALVLPSGTESTLPERQILLCYAAIAPLLHQLLLHRHRETPPGTLVQIARQCGIKGPQLRRLCSCPERLLAWLRRPLMLRAQVDDVIRLRLHSQVSHVPLALEIADNTMGVIAVQAQRWPVAAGQSADYWWHCRRSGIYPLRNRCLPAGAPGSLLGLLLVEE